MQGAFDRTKLLIGEDKYITLKNAKVIVFGVGGVGGYAVEGLVRSGIENIAIVDDDKISPSNLNRQIIATENAIGESKVQVCKERILSINPNANVTTYNKFYLPSTADEIDLKNYDYVIDAVDTVSAKIELVKRANELGVKIISCMGTGGKLDPTKLIVTDLFKTDTCPLAKVMRKEIKALNITKLKVVYSTEQPKFDSEQMKTAEKKENGRAVPPSMVFVPATAGLLLAKEVVLDLIKEG